MNNLEIKIEYEVNWRINEISTIKALPFLYKFSSQQHKLLQKHTIPILYSLWEGFVIESLAIYAGEINSLNLTKKQLCSSLVTHSLDHKLKLQDGKTEFNKQISFVQEINNFLENTIQIPTRVSTESNVNYKVINNLLTRFNLPLFPEANYKNQLNKLLLFRNAISHGDNAIPVNQVILDEMSYLVISCIHELTEKIISGYQEKTYLNRI
jgi:hypothetical protein